MNCCILIICRTNFTLYDHFVFFYFLDYANLKTFRTAEILLLAKRKHNIQELREVIFSSFLAIFKNDVHYNANTFGHILMFELFVSGCRIYFPGAKHPNAFHLCWFPGRWSPFVLSCKYVSRLLSQYQVCFNFTLWTNIFSAVPQTCGSLVCFFINIHIRSKFVFAEIQVFQMTWFLFFFSDSWCHCHICHHFATIFC